MSRPVASDGKCRNRRVVEDIRQHLQVGVDQDVSHLANQLAIAECNLVMADNGCSLAERQANRRVLHGQVEPDRVRDGGHIRAVWLHFE